MHLVVVVGLPPSHYKEKERGGVEMPPPKMIRVRENLSLNTKFSVVMICSTSIPSFRSITMLCGTDSVPQHTL